MLAQKERPKNQVDFVDALDPQCGHDGIELVPVCGMTKPNGRRRCVRLRISEASKKKRTIIANEYRDRATNRDLPPLAKVFQINPADAATKK
jgi:hypothetical protein